MSCRVRTLLLAALTFCFVAPSASAAPTRPLGGTLGDLWTTVLETPSAENPFVTGNPACIDLGGNTVAPFTPPPGRDFTCTVQRGTKIFVAASTWECSTFPGDHFDFGTTEADLRECARQNDEQVPTVTIDGQPAPVSEVETQLLSIDLPEDNIFGLTGADRNGRFVAHGWVVRLNPLAPGTHTIEIDIEGRQTFTTMVIVK